MGSPGQTLFECMEIPLEPRMFFVLSGQLIYAKQDGEQEELNPGDWLCEPVLWTSWMHIGQASASAKTSTQTYLLALSAKTFQNTLMRFRAADFPVHLYARSFVKWLNDHL